MRSRKKLFYPVFPVQNVELDWNSLDHQVLGRGKFGKIYKLDEVTVLKVMPKFDVINEKMVTQVKDEKANHSTCSHHANVLALLDVWQDDYSLYMLYPLCKESLFGVAKRVGVFKAEIILSVIAKVSSAISFIHDMNIVHRDVKLENILVSMDGRELLLGDFGLSKKLSKRKRANTICGTLVYMAPEITQEKSYDFDVDWWSFGILLYRLANGQLPFAKASNHQQMAQIISSSLDKTLDKITHDNDQIQAVMKSCLTFDAGQRNLAMQQLSNDLKQIASAHNDKSIDYYSL